MIGHTWVGDLRMLVQSSFRIGEEFDRQSVIALASAIIARHPNAVTPEQTISWALQKLGNEGTIEFVDNDGTYKRVN